MMTSLERQQLRRLLDALDESDGQPSYKRKQRENSRHRDEKGRYTRDPAKVEAEALELRWGKTYLKKVKGSYGTYLVKRKWLTKGEEDLLIVGAILFVMWLIF